MFTTGYLRLFRVFGVPVRVHWTILLAALVFSRFSFRPGTWVGLFLIIFIHEVGHLILARRAGCEVYSIEMHGLGGMCLYSGYPPPLQSALIAWGGVFAQGLLFGLGLLLAPVLAAADSPHVYDFLDMLFATNLLIMGLNLLPFQGLDGKKAWTLPGILWRRYKSRTPMTKPRKKGKPSRKGADVIDLHKDLTKAERDEIARKVKESMTKEQQKALADKIEEMIDEAVEDYQKENEEQD